VTEAELQKWWPDLGTLLAELRRGDRPAVADLLVDAAPSGATSSEILGGLGVVLRDHRALRSQLSDSAASAWDAIMNDVNHAFPGSKPTQRFVRLTAGRTFRARGGPRTHA
jgi:hypothetical protein